MRRAPIVLTATVAGVAGVLGFQPHQASPPATTVASATAKAPRATPASGSSGDGKSGSSAAGGLSSSGSSRRATKTATGTSISTPYGNAAVRVTVSGGKVTGIEPLELQGADAKSVEISSSAEPVLRESALAKQSANVDAVSGATFTSASYAASLQSALDKLGFTAADGSRDSLAVPQGESRG